MLLFFSVAFEIMLGLGLVMYIFTGFGLMVGIAKTRLDWKYSFFYIELVAILLLYFQVDYNNSFILQKKHSDSRILYQRFYLFSLYCHHHQSSKSIYCKYDWKVPKGIYEGRKKSYKRTTAKTK